MTRRCRWFGHRWQRWFGEHWIEVDWVVPSEVPMLRRCRRCGKEEWTP